MYTSVDRKSLKSINISESYQKHAQPLIEQNLVVKIQRNRKRTINILLLNKKERTHDNIQHFLKSRTRASDPRSQIVYQQKIKTNACWALSEF